MSWSRKKKKKKKKKKKGNNSKSKQGRVKVLLILHFLSCSLSFYEVSTKSLEKLLKGNNKNKVSKVELGFFMALPLNVLYHLKSLNKIP